MYGKINWLDVLKGAGIAALASILMAIFTFTQAGQFPDCWSCAGGWSVPVYTALGCFTAYIIKNLFTNSQGQVFKKEPNGI
jgi:hypothetical protein